MVAFFVYRCTLIIFVNAKINYEKNCLTVSDPNQLKL